MPWMLEPGSVPERATEPDWALEKSWREAVGASPQKPGPGSGLKWPVLAWVPRRQVAPASGPWMLELAWAPGSLGAALAWLRLASPAAPEMSEPGLNLKLLEEASAQQRQTSPIGPQKLEPGWSCSRRELFSALQG